MPLAPGDHLGPYQITALIGKGGMGEVYQAHDPRLRRDVAIKVSRDQFTDRFTREARTVASLNHTNIAHLYDVGPNYLVMEYVEGADLKGPLAFDDALPIIEQLIDGIEAAHDKNIIHRDLKPANIKVTPDGVVKILDFGLAKAMDPAPAGTDPDLSPTLTMGATAAGTILGTAAYMAPEQAKGKEADKRADIWSFAVVLYELLTGQRMFAGESTVEILSAVLNKDPDLSAAPARVQRLLNHCLNKDRKHRLASISDARLFLLAEPSAPPAQNRESNRADKLPWAIAAALAVAALSLALAWWQASQPEPRPITRLTVDLGPDVDLGEVRSQELVISPDGTRIAYLASVAGGPFQIYTRRLDQSSATALRGTEGATGEVRIAFSPDSQWIAFTQREQLKKISVDGGAAVLLHKAAANIIGIAWSGDTIFFGSSAPPALSRISSDGKGLEVLTKATGDDLGNVFPHGLPGGKAVLFTAPTQLGENTADLASIASFSLADKVRKTLVRGGIQPRHSPTGHLLYVNHATLYAIPFDPDKLETRGTAVPVLTDLSYHAATGEPSYSLSANGTLIYRAGAVSGEKAPLSTVHWLDRAGRRQPLIETPDSFRDLRLSPDAQRLAAIVVPSLNSRVITYDIQRRSTARISAEDQIYSGPVWSPDGRYILWRTVRGAQAVRSDGSVQPQTFLEVYAPSSFSPDGRRLLFDTGINATDISSVPIQEEGGQLKVGKPEPFVATPALERGARFSPDGHWVAYVSNESGRNEVNVRAFPPPASGEGAKFTISTDGGVSPVWSRSGTELYYQSGDRIMVVTYKAEGDKFTSTPPRVWAELKGATFWDIAPDGRAVITAPVESASQPAARNAEHTIVYIENFFEELRRKAPLP